METRNKIIAIGYRDETEDYVNSRMITILNQNKDE